MDVDLRNLCSIRQSCFQFLTGFWHQRNEEARRGKKWNGECNGELRCGEENERKMHIRNIILDKNVSTRHFGSYLCGRNPNRHANTPIYTESRTSIVSIADMRRLRCFASKYHEGSKRFNADIEQMPHSNLPLCSASIDGESAPSKDRCRKIDFVQ